MNEHAAVASGAQTPTLGGPPRGALLSSGVDETFEAVVVGWDGTLVPDRHADAAAARAAVEALCAAGVHVFIVTGSDAEMVDRQLAARPHGPGRLHLCCNRGSEVFEITTGGLVLLHRRIANGDEDLALDRAAQATVSQLADRGLDARVVSKGLNRRTVDLVPAREWADPGTSEMDRLAEAVAGRLTAAGIGDLAEVVALSAEASRRAGLADPRVTSDVKHVEIGLTDQGDSARFAADWLAAEGITGRLVLIAGDAFGPVGGAAGSDSLMMVAPLGRAVVVSVGGEPAAVPGGVLPLGGGPQRLLALFEAQLARRRRRRVPGIDADPAWALPLPAGDDVAESIGALANGWAGTRAAREEGVERAGPELFVADVYTPEGQLLPAPAWTALELAADLRLADDRRLLDLRTGVLAREGSLRSLRLVSATAPHALAMRAEGDATLLLGGGPLVAPPGAERFERADGGGVLAAAVGSPGVGVAVAARDETAADGDLRVVERLAAWARVPGRAGSDEARRWLTATEGVGFERLLADHRREWARRWADAEVVIEGSPQDQLAARFAVFQVLAAVADQDEAAVGARGLTGTHYAGHVFWDADVFVLPVLAALRPRAARAMIEYRIRRLPAAREAARALGRRGARFPWESSGDGHDVTPRSVRGPDDHLVPIATGLHEEHIVADVAWAAWQYVAWTGDTALLAGEGCQLVVDTARYWASRVRRAPDGSAHLYGVEGPDEYHSVVDDNAFTNVMARWNLRRGADLLEQRTPPSPEVAEWREVADALVDGWRPDRRCYEQFAGYFGLEDLVASDVGTPPFLAELVLGAERVRRSQLIKQADVLMLHHLVPDEVVPGSLDPCLDYYEPRTSLGSSLAPAVHASLLARAGRTERALELFRMSAQIDLADLTHSTASGLHLAALGGTWQALAFGFLGLAARGPTLCVDPKLPGEWEALALRLRFLGRAVGVRAEHDRVAVTCQAPLFVEVAGRPARRVSPPGATFPLVPPAG